MAERDEQAGDETTPSSSSPTMPGDRLTPPESADSGSDDLGLHLGAGEAYELQERVPGKRDEVAVGDHYHHYHHHYQQHDSAEDDGDEEEEERRGGGEEYEDGESAVRGRGRDGRRRRRRASASTTASFQLYSPDEERAVVRKFDRRLVVFVALLYMLSFLDRSNIGNARIAGMDEDLHSSFPTATSENQDDGWYEWALSAFYMTYIGFEWMSLLWRLIPAHVYVATIVFSWGLVASLQAVAVNYPMLVCLRALLGIGEAAFTGIPIYLSFFFKREELAFRTAIFVSAAPLATSFASSLAWLIVKFGENGPIAPWRLLFLVEGFPSVAVAVLAWSTIPDSPQTAHYLTAREKKVAFLRLRHERPAKNQNQGHGRRKVPADTGEGDDGGGSPRLSRRDVLAVFVDPVAWLTAVMFFLTNMAYSSLPVFLPTILRAMGYDTLRAQALAAPPYLVAFVAVLATAAASDRMRSRAPLIVAHALASAAGYGVLALADTPLLRLPPSSVVRYVAVYPAAAGFFNVVVLTIAWTINNQRGASRQGGGFALLQVVGQCGPLLGIRLYPEADAPFYSPGMRACAAAMLGVAVLAGVLRFYLARLNRQLDREEVAGEMGAGAGTGTGTGRDGEGGLGEEGEEGAEEEEGLVGGRRETRLRSKDPFRYML